MVAMSIQVDISGTGFGPPESDNRPITPSFEPPEYDGKAAERVVGKLPFELPVKYTKSELSRAIFT